MDNILRFRKYKTKEDRDREIAELYEDEIRDKTDAFISEMCKVQTTNKEDV